MGNKFNYRTKEVPQFYICRDILKNNVIESLNNSSVFVSGIKGMGKSCFLKDVSETLLKNENLIVFPFSFDNDIVQDFVTLLKKKNNSFSRLYNLESVVNLHSLAELIGSIKNYNFIFVIDDFSSYFYTFFETFRELGVKFLISGEKYIFKKFYSDAQNNVKIFELPLLSIGTMTDVYRNTFMIDEKKAYILATITGGYPAAFQILGSLMYENQLKLDNDLLAKFDDILLQYSYDRFIRDLSNIDLRILSVYPELDEEVKTLEIRKAVDMSSASFAVYRQRLIDAGLLKDTRYGFTKVTLPRLVEIIKKNF